MASSTRLKLLEFNMQLAMLKEYNTHYVHATRMFYDQSKYMIKFREEMCVKHPGRDWWNANDTKVGKDYFIVQLEKAGLECYNLGPDGRTPRQTLRPTIALKDAILPWIKFEQPEFQRVLTWLKEQVITETKGVFKDLTATVNGFTFVFGLGGIHGSVEREKVVSDDEWVIESRDVTSYYPNLAIKN